MMNEHPLTFPAQAVINAHSGESTVTGRSRRVESVSREVSCVMDLE